MIKQAESNMARREFPQFEAVSAMVPAEGGGYHAAIAVKALGMGGAPRFHKVLDGQVFKGARGPRAAGPGRQAPRARGLGGGGGGGGLSP
ncbi:hypothetical protein ACOQNR_07745, partial [Pseudomonas juntendi]|uniref:hypothetical protein n=1 Tax=Pseudomonas juntendi TaxID=2666183 RepID=UPI003B956D14